MQLQPPESEQGALRLLANETGKTFQDVSTGKDLSNRSPAAQDRMPTTEEGVVMTWQSFCTSKETVKQVKRQPTGGKESFPSCASDRALLFKICI